MTDATINNCLAILEDELVPALGCTEPIAVAYGAAKVREALGQFPIHLTAYCSGNIVKNVKAVTVPNSNGLRGIDAAATLGAVGGRPEKLLEVLNDVTEDDVLRTRELLDQGFCSTRLASNVDKLYLRIVAEGEGCTASVTIQGHHTNITQITRNDQILYEIPFTSGETDTRKGDRSLLTMADILAFADAVDPAQLERVLSRQIECNLSIAQEGLSTRYGAGVAMALLDGTESSPFLTAKAKAAAASEARMAGCALPVVINSGSGNQGITVSVPVVEYAKNMGIPQEKMYRALAVSNLTSIHLKYYIGDLSAFCGAVTAACGVGAALAYLNNGGYDMVADTITNTLASVSGIFCDGAKPSCAAKVASALDMAYLSYRMARQNRVFNPGEGVVGGDVEQTIRSIGHIGKEGMDEADQEILRIMLETN